MLRKLPVDLRKFFCAVGKCMVKMYETQAWISSLSAMPKALLFQLTYAAPRCVRDSSFERRAFAVFDRVFSTVREAKPMVNFEERSPLEDIERRWLPTSSAKTIRT